MGAAILLNMVILRGRDSGVDIDGEAKRDLSAQIFCVALESLHSEGDTVVLERRMGILGCLLSFEANENAEDDRPLRELAEGLGLSFEVESACDGPTRGQPANDLARKVLALLK